MLGFQSTLNKQFSIAEVNFKSSIGAGLRYDNIFPSELDHTQKGEILSIMQLGKTKQLNTHAFFNENINFGNWLISAGLRIDYFHFYYQNLSNSSYASNLFEGTSPTADKTIISPKFSIQNTIDSKFQIYFKAGKGFHSNDARTVIANKGNDILPASYGTDLGFNWKVSPRLYVNTAIWYLFLQSELTFGQDLTAQPGGSINPSGRTSRVGLDISARYQWNDWLYSSLNLNLAKPKYIDSTAGHNYLALVPTFTSTAGLFFHKSTWNGGISYRYLHNKPANSDNTLTALGYFITDLTINYSKPNYEIGLSIENLFNFAWNESQFAYTSQLKNESKPITEISYTPGVPFFAKLKYVVYF